MQKNLRLASDRHFNPSGHILVRLRIKKRFYIFSKVLFFINDHCDFYDSSIKCARYGQQKTNKAF